MSSYSRMPSQRVFSTQPSKGAWRCQLDGCDQSFPDQRDLIRHQKTAKKHNNEPSYVCQACGTNFTRKDALSRHVKSKHTMDGGPPSADMPYPYSGNNYRFVDNTHYHQRNTSPTPSSGSDRSVYTPGSTSSSDYESSPRSASRSLHTPQIADPTRMMPPSTLPWIYTGHPSDSSHYGPVIEAGQLPSIRALQLPKPQGRHH